MKDILIYCFILFFTTACSTHNITFTDDEKIINTQSYDKIAIVVAEKAIKSYTNMIVDSSIVYLLNKNNDIQVKVYTIGTENRNSIKNVLEELENDGFYFVITGFTKNGINILNNISNAKDFLFLIPNINKNDILIHRDNFIFSGIDYKTQIEKLLEISNENISIFYDDVSMLPELNQLVTNSIKNENQILEFYKTANKQNEFIEIFHPKLKIENEINEELNNEDLIDMIQTIEDDDNIINENIEEKPISPFNNKTIFTNLFPIKTSLLLSQIKVNDVLPFVVLSTQINYNPAILKLSQSIDRQNFIIANSIFNTSSELSYINEILGQNLNYNFIVYSTTVGLDYIYATFMNPQPRIFSEIVENNQIIYDVKLMKASTNSFKEYNNL